MSEWAKVVAASCLEYWPQILLAVVLIGPMVAMVLYLAWPL